MQETGNKKISLQVSLNGFSMNIGCARSGWLGADRIFSCEQLHDTYDQVEISAFTPKFALVPEGFFTEDKARQILSETVTLSSDDEIKCIRVPELGAWAIYSLGGCSPACNVLRSLLVSSNGMAVDVLPEQYYLLKAIYAVNDYNKVIASYADGYLYLVVAQGRTLLLCNAFKAADFTTAEYFIFMVMKKFQLNPEVSSIWFRTPLSQDEEFSLYNYFKSVEIL